MLFRSIKKIEADRRRTEKSKAGCLRGLKFWSGEMVLVNRTTSEKRTLAITEENRAEIVAFLGHDSDLGWLHMPRKEGDRKDFDQEPSVHTALAGDYPNLYAPRTVTECRERALRAYARSVEHCERWLAHYDNRLAYERAMMAEDGGMVTDQTGPEIGGAVRSIWAPRGGWAYIVRVNRVTLTIRHQWNAGGRIFDKNLPFDKVPEIMSKAQVDAARAAGRILEVPELGFLLAPEKDPTPSPEEPKDPTEAPALICAPPAEAPKPKAEDFQAMKKALRSGVKVVAVPQLFPTPKELAERMADLADIRPGHRCLEPSVGTGVLLGAMGGRMFEEPGLLPYKDRDQLHAVEINADLAKRVEAEFPLTKVHCADFLLCNGALGKFDRILMNPPFKNGIDIVHIRHALNFLKPGGKLVAICAGGPKQETALQPIADSWEILPEGTFKEQGTGVRTVLATFTKD